MAKKKYFGCNEDCFNCIYSDCLKPAKMMHSIDEDEGRGKKNRGRIRNKENFCNCVERENR